MKGSGGGAIWVLMMGLLIEVLSACSDYKCNDYSEYRRLDAEGWRYADSLCFVPVHADSLCRGRFVVGVTQTDRYPFTTLCMEVAMTDGGVRRADTVVMRVVDRYGSWTGRGLGSSFQLTDTLAPVTHASGTPVTVRHIMRADTLTGVGSVGLFFVPQ